MSLRFVESRGNEEGESKTSFQYRSLYERE